MSHEDAKLLSPKWVRLWGTVLVQYYKIGWFGVESSKLRLSTCIGVVLTCLSNLDSFVNNHCIYHLDPISHKIASFTQQDYRQVLLLEI